MIRNSILYRRLWYVKRRRTKNIHIYARIAILILILALTTSYVGRKLIPCIEDISGIYVKTVVATIVNDAVNSSLNNTLNRTSDSRTSNSRTSNSRTSDSRTSDSRISDSRISNGEAIDNSLLLVSKDENGRVTLIETDEARLNKLSREISSYIEEKLSLAGQKGIMLPSGALLGNSIFADSGPDVNVKILTDGNVETTFRTELSSAGTNQTRLCILMQVRTHIKIAAPLVVKTLDLSFNVPVAETVIVGEAPEIRQP